MMHTLVKENLATIKQKWRGTRTHSWQPRNNN
jgi:hypothetical protein